jgi:hypothetical protein
MGIAVCLLHGPGCSMCQEALGLEQTVGIYNWFMVQSISSLLCTMGGVCMPAVCPWC